MLLFINNACINFLWYFLEAKWRRQTGQKQGLFFVVAGHSVGSGENTFSRPNVLLKSTKSCILMLNSPEIPHVL